MTPEQWIAASGVALSVFLTCAGAALKVAFGWARRLAALETRMETVIDDLRFATTVSAARVLHREDDGHRLDDLIDAFLAERITQDELHVFVERLERVRDSAEMGPIERRSAEMLLREVHERFDLPQPRSSP